MKVTTSFKNFDHYKRLEAKIHKVSDKLTKYYKNNMEISWVCQKIEDGSYYCEVKLLTPFHSFYAKYKGEDIFESLHQLVSKLEKQLCKTLDKTKTRIHSKRKKSFKEYQVEKMLLDEDWVQSNLHKIKVA